jgi:hypothetical protein
LRLPNKAARRAARANGLKPGGYLLIDHTAGHLPKSSTVLDPFGATREAVIQILTDIWDGCAVFWTEPATPTIHQP